jgi:hypothetical protein
MDYLVLNGASYPTSYSAGHYRGTDRKEPGYCDAVPDDSEINCLFRWYVEELHRSGAVHDLVRARRYVELCNAYFREQRFEIIEVRRGREQLGGAGRLLGFDISNGGYGSSLIFESLLPGPDATIPEQPILILSDLLRRYFYPRLNKSGLFATFEDAAHCRQTMIALQSFHPDLYEGGDLEDFEVVGIYLVPDAG